MEPQRNSDIRNAQVRYKRRVADLSTSAHIYARTEARRKEPNDPSEETAVYYSQSDKSVRGRGEQLLLAQQRKEAERAFTEEGLSYEPEEITEILRTPEPGIPSFPYLLLILALIKDLLDSLDLTGVGAILTTVLSLLMGGILFVWILAKFKGAAWKRKQAKKMAARLLLVCGVEFIPFLKIIPSNTIWVLMAYSDEKRAAEGIRTALGKLQSLKRLIRR